jgi:hypothetical protein
VDDYGSPENPPDIAMVFKNVLVPVALHQAFAYSGAGEATTGKEYHQPGNYVHDT